MRAKFSLKGDQNVVRPFSRGVGVMAAAAAFLLLGPSPSGPRPAMAGLFSGGDTRTIGVVVADEPHAAIAARGILEAGGSVGDAAAALYFTMAVTYPVAAGLGGGGVCLHYDGKTKSAGSIDFLPRAARGGGAVAVPGAVRGFSYLHARYGRLSWAEVLAPAEHLAALGFPMSRALASALKAHSDLVKKSAFLSRLFVDGDGQLLGEGDEIRQIPLAGTLAVIRGRGPLGFYSIPFGSEIIRAAGRQAGAVSEADLTDYRAEAAPATAVTVGPGIILAPAEKTGAGALAAAILPEMSGRVSPADPAQIGADAQAAVTAALQRFGVKNTLKDFGSTGFLVADREGNAIACGISMSRPFGTAQEVDQAGFALAPAPAQAEAGLAGAFLMPLMATDAQTKDLLFSGVSAGTPAGVTTVFALARAGLTRNHALLDPTRSATPADPASHVNVLACTKGLASDLSSCTAAADPEGHGVALQAVPQSGVSPSRSSRGSDGGFLGLF